jgi:CheY-like chemotaxis protein
MDMQMPVMDGLIATRAIREMSGLRAKKIPIIAMTANAFREDIEACKKAGMNEHISKPVDADEVHKLIDKYLNKGHRFKVCVNLLSDVE